ncbi:MAG: aminotransferase class I/II-fold pyridoxal phosphate-dependent enzyme [Clostridia bacterium]
MIPSDMSVLDKLKEYNEKNVIPMHMPGHKRNVDMAGFLFDLGARYDITEIPGFDDLHDPAGMLHESMKKASDLWHSASSFFLVNGSTCGILSGIRALTKYGDRVLVARNSHKSVYNAIEICGLDPVFIMPPVEPSLGIYASIPADAVEDALDTYEDIKMVVITSPTYDGVISDIRKICEYAHKKHIPVLVDEAHGAHLGFSDYFPGGSVSAGADIVVQSLHKTLAGLTQTAIMHLNGDILSENDIKRQLDIFETSSPSYLLMASIDGCIRLISASGGKLFHDWEERLGVFDSMVMDLKNLHIFSHGNDRYKYEGIYAMDPSKIVISTKGTGLQGIELFRLLLDKYNIQLEMASIDNATALTGIGGSKEDLSAFASALNEIDAQCGKCTEDASYCLPCAYPKKVMSICKAIKSRYRFINTCDAIDAVSAEYVFAYPPGIPIIIPGEQIDCSVISVIAAYKEHGIELKSSLGSTSDTIAVLV